MNEPKNDAPWAMHPEPGPLAVAPAGVGGYPAPTPAEAAEFSLLMSLALDEALEPAEMARFQRYLATYPTLATQWRRWQQMDERLRAVPAMEPPPEFRANVLARLDRQTRRQRLWLGTGIAFLSLLLWLTALGGTYLLVTFLFFQQAEWLVHLVHWVAYWSAAASEGLAALRATVISLLATPQVRLLCGMYLLSAFLILGLWTRLLRRSTQVEPGVWAEG
ncbi:hypothetical protein FKZ61_004445 [Litorilinea aerophila]|uniref:Uncharacterized protein n=1 Tax=Litorilinea aerophila TaxID=1204385 RepID=A0A540VKG0_9CHLR|nr:hypothetical protein [Litorilinea aerophila]MCC9075359.1 hypothetical protein [Litorilinea aerophila]